MFKVDIYKKLQHFNIDISFTVDKEVLVIKGPSGSGKTTILDCIAGIKQPDKGSIVINDRVIYSSEDKINVPIKDRNIGYVFQDYALFPHMTVKNNILFGIKSKGLKDLRFAEYLMKALRIEHLENSYPSRISGGEKQRAALARALSTSPELLLLDEPFSALDYDTKLSVYQEFKEFRKSLDIDIILITHDDEEANLLGDRIINIKNGVLVL